MVLRTRAPPSPSRGIASSDRRNKVWLQACVFQALLSHPRLCSNLADLRVLLFSHAACASLIVPTWHLQVCVLGPLRTLQSLVMSGLLREGSNVGMITSEGGSVSLRTELEGGNNYG